jgi:hypothetical protein
VPSYAASEWLPRQPQCRRPPRLAMCLIGRGPRFPLPCDSALGRLAQPSSRALPLPPGRRSRGLVDPECSYPCKPAAVASGARHCGTERCSRPSRQRTGPDGRQDCSLAKKQESRPAVPVVEHQTRRWCLRANASFHGVSTVSPRRALRAGCASSGRGPTSAASARVRRAARGARSDRWHGDDVVGAHCRVGPVAVLDRLRDREAIGDRGRAAPSRGRGGAGRATMSTERNRDG